MADTNVLIVGAGPTGLVLALWLSKLGVSVRILDKTEKPGTTSRALAVHARTLELYQQLDLSDAVIQKGHKVPAVNLWVKGKRETRVDFTDVGDVMTPYPFLHIFPQDEHEKLLIARLEALGIRVERQTEMTGFLDSGEHITATINGPNGKETVECLFSFLLLSLASLLWARLGAYVRFGSKAVIRPLSAPCPLCANSGHWAQQCI